MPRTASLGDAYRSRSRLRGARLLGALFGGLWAWIPSAWAEAPAPPPPRPPLVVVRAVGEVEPALLRAACRSVLEAYPVRCEVRGERGLEPLLEAWDPGRLQLEARVLLEAIFRHRRADDGVVELDLTRLDLYEHEKPFVFGLASLTDRVAVVSLARIVGEPAQTDHRLRKLVLHEVGHALGLRHHDDPRCVMRQDPTVESLDHAPPGLCPSCHRALRAEAGRVSRPGQSLLDKARGHLARGEAQPAREAVVRALWEGHDEPELLEDFAAVFLQFGHLNEAISLLEHVVSHHPRRARTRARLGVAYQLRERSGDAARALAHMEAALALEPDWSRLQEHVDALRRSLPSAQGP